MTSLQELIGKLIERYEELVGKDGEIWCHYQCALPSGETFKVKSRYISTCYELRDEWLLELIKKDN